MAPTSLVIEGTTVVVSVLVGSLLAYWFGSRSARRERLFDSRVTKYDELISLADDLRAAVVTFKALQDYDSKSSNEPMHDFVWIVGLSGRALGTDRMLALAKELDFDQQGPLRTKSSKRKLVENVVERFGTEIALEIGRKGERIRRVKYSLQVVGSTAILSDAYKGLEAAIERIGLESVGKMFSRHGIADASQVDSQAAQAALEHLGGAVEAFLVEVQRELRRTL